MTGLAIGRLVPPQQGECGFIMIERVDGLIQFPPVRTMANAAADLKILPVRRIRKQVD
jgi:hypothetical protein